MKPVMHIRPEWEFEGAFPGGGRKLTPQEASRYEANAPKVQEILTRMEAGELSFEDAMEQIKALRKSVADTAGASPS